MFFAGIALRLAIFRWDHDEGDELIYKTLVEQLELGHGYTLLGSPVLESGRIDQAQYSSPLFFHPPGGIALFLLLHVLFGTQGFALAQLLCYAIFFGSMIVLARLLIKPEAGLAMCAIAILTAFTPIAVHVMNHYWLDGPLLAFTTLAAALFVSGAAGGNLRRMWFAGFVLGYATLIKVTAVITAPGIILLAWSLKPNISWREIFRFSLRLLIPLFIFYVPWKAWQIIQMGTLFPPQPLGRPSESMLATNSFVRYITTGRSPWIYLSLLPRVLWSLPAALVLFVKFREKTDLRRIGGALLVWIMIVVFIHIGLGFFGFSKLMRYVILVTPASILLFGMVTAECRGWWLALLVAGMVLETAQGVQTMLTKTDLIIPLWGSW